MMPHALARILAPLTAVAFLLGAADTRADGHEDQTALFHKVKDKEALEKLPPAVATEDIGTYDCASGAWKGLEDTPPPPSTPKPNPKGIVPPPPSPAPPHVSMFARKALFRFKATHRTKPLHIVLQDYKVTNGARAVTGGPPKVVHADKDEVSIDLGAWGLAFYPKDFDLGITFTVSCGEAQPKFGRISFTRVPPAGAGVYTIPALPVTVIYAPPLDAQKKNQMKYEASQFFGTSIVLSHNTGGSDKQDASTPPLYAGSQFQQVASPLGQALSAIPATAPIGKVFSVLSDGLGTVSSTHTDGFDEGGKRSLTVRSGTIQKWSTTSGPTALGPGEDDMIVYMHNANIAWMGPPIEAPEVRIALLDYKVLMTPTVHELKADLAELSRPGTSPKATGKNSLVDAATIRALLKLDPLAENPTAALPPSRYYVKSPCAEVNAGGGTTALSLEESYESEQSSVETKLETEQWNKGMLSWMGDGVDHNETMTTTIKNFRSKALHGSSKSYAVASLNVDAATHETYFVRTYFDRVFGSFVVQKCRP